MIKFNEAFLISFKFTQGAIFRDFKYIQWVDELDHKEIDIPFFVVLTQSCDLESHFKDEEKPISDERDKYLNSILVCPAYVDQLVRQGVHLKSLNLIRQTHNSKTWPLIKDNNNARYHFLEENPKLELPPLVLDFKQYYTIPIYILLKLEANYVGDLGSLYREKLSQRFAFYLSRIGLPTIPKDEKVASEK